MQILSSLGCNAIFDVLICTNSNPSQPLAKNEPSRVLETPATATETSASGENSNHTALYTHIKWRRWGKALERLKSFPEEASKWIFEKGENEIVEKYLPLHLVCKETTRQYQLVKLLITIYPDAVRTKDHAGRLPLHLFCLGVTENSANAFHENVHGVQNITVLLLSVFPEGMFVKDNNQCLPMKIISDGVRRLGRTKATDSIVLALNNCLMLLEKQKSETSEAVTMQEQQNESNNFNEQLCTLILKYSHDQSETCEHDSETAAASLQLSKPLTEETPTSSDTMDSHCVHNPFTKVLNPDAQDVPSVGNKVESHTGVQSEEATQENHYESNGFNEQLCTSMVIDEVAEQGNGYDQSETCERDSETTAVSETHTSSDTTVSHSVHDPRTEVLNADGQEPSNVGNNFESRSGIKSEAAMQENHYESNGFNEQLRTLMVIDEVAELRNSSEVFETCEVPSSYPNKKGNPRRVGMRKMFHLCKEENAIAQDKLTNTVVEESRSDSICTGELCLASKEERSALAETRVNLDHEEIEMNSLKTLLEYVDEREKEEVVLGIEEENVVAVDFRSDTIGTSEPFLALKEENFPQLATSVSHNYEEIATDSFKTLLEDVDEREKNDDVLSVEEKNAAFSTTVRLCDSTITSKKEIDEREQQNNIESLPKDSTFESYKRIENWHKKSLRVSYLVLFTVLTVICTIYKQTGNPIELLVELSNLFVFLVEHPVVLLKGFASFIIFLLYSVHLLAVELLGIDC